MPSTTVDWLTLCEPVTRDFESCKLKSYLDTVANPPVWTVGWGATGPDIGPDTVWTQQEADDDLQSRLFAIHTEVIDMVTVAVSAGQIAALCDFAYEEGVEALRGSTLLAKLNTGDYGGASLEFLRWDKAGGKDVAGIERRRVADRQLFDEHPAPPTPAATPAPVPAYPGHRTFLEVLVGALGKLVGSLFRRG